MKAVITYFDDFLAEQGLSFQAIVIGGAALIIMDIIDRPTQDVDCLDPEIPLVAGAGCQSALAGPCAYVNQRSEQGAWL